MRLDKFLAHNTGLTRNQARRAIRRESVTVNGEAVHHVAALLPENAVVSYNGTIIQNQGPQYWMLHKPAGCVSATQDRQWPTARALLPADAADDLHIAGRLDRDTTGLLLFSNDGTWTHHLTSPRRGCEKRYRLHTNTAIPHSAIADFAHGIMLHGEQRLTKPAKLCIIAPCQAELTLTEGRYHQVKRMLHSVGCEVTALHRLRIGGIVLDATLAPGEARRLTDLERDSVAVE